MSADDKAYAHKDALHGPATFDAERKIAWARLAVVASGTILYPLVAPGPDQMPTLAYTLLASAWAYSALVLWLEPYRRHPALMTSVAIRAGDLAFTLAWIVATGGVRSPWTVALAVGIAALAFRHPPRQIVPLAGAYTLAYVAVVAALGQLAGNGPKVAVDVVYVLFAATLGVIVARERLAVLASRLRLLDLTQEVANVGSWEWSVVDGSLTWSEELYRIFGVARSFTPTYEGYLAAVHPDDRERVEQVIRTALIDRSSFVVEHRIVTPDGRTRWLHCRGRTITDADGQPRELMGSSQDVTERREIIAQLTLAGRLSSIGTLASGIAHEINNPLAYVATNLEVIDRALASTERPADAAEISRLREAVASARHGASRMRKIVRGLKAFARADDDTRGPVDLRRVVELAADVVAHEIRPRARLTTCWETSRRALGNESRLSQVVVNLLVNAAQAIERGGPEENEIRVVVRDEGDDRVAVEVSDTGVGIAPENLDRIFDPFFSTKPTGEGTGLGLPISHRIVRELGGEIGVKSAVGRGSTFTVTLPVARAAASAEEAPAAVAARRAKVLIVDDEKRYVASLRMLLASDYDVATATDGPTALARLASGERFDVILCDLMMPGMTGVDVYEALSTAAPDMRSRVVFLTGGATNDATRAFLDRSGVRCLEKPLEIGELEAVLADVVAA